MALVTVILPTHRNDAFLQQAIENILCQTHHDFELLVIEDGCHVDLPEDDRIRRWKTPFQHGLPRCLNFGLLRSRGDFITRIDSDDLCPPNRIELLLEANRPFVTSRYKRIDMCGDVVQDRWMERANSVSAEEIHDNIWEESLIVGPAPMMSREVIREVGWFDEIMAVASDYNYMLRALSNFRINIVEETLYYHRLNPNSHRRNDYGNVDFGKLARERAKSVVYDPAEL